MQSKEASLNVRRYRFPWGTTYRIIVTWASTANSESIQDWNERHSLLFWNGSWKTPIYRTRVIYQRRRNYWYFFLFAQIVPNFASSRRLFSTPQERYIEHFMRFFIAYFICIRRSLFLPPKQTPDRIQEDNKFWPYFADCIGALDGTLIEAWVPSGDQGP